jgi:hypothetical protein
MLTTLQNAANPRRVVLLFSLMTIGLAAFERPSWMVLVIVLCAVLTALWRTFRHKCSVRGFAQFVALGAMVVLARVGSESLFEQDVVGAHVTARSPAAMRADRRKRPYDDAFAHAMQRAAARAYK